MKLNKYLSEHSLTQRDFAAMARVTQPQVARWINGMHPSLENRFLIHKATDGRVNIEIDWPRRTTSSKPKRTERTTQRTAKYRTKS